MQEARTAPLPFCPLQAPQHEAGRGPTRSFQCSMLKEAAEFLPLAGNTLQLLGGILLKSLPSNGSALRGLGSSDSPGRELGQEATMLVPAPGSRWLQPGHAGSRGGLCACHGTGQGATAQGRASPVPGNFSLSSWMSALAPIKIKSIFFCCKKRHCSGRRFPRVSSCVCVTGREKPTGSWGCKERLGLCFIQGGDWF